MPSRRCAQPQNGRKRHQTVGSIFLLFAVVDWVLVLFAAEGFVCIIMRRRCTPLGLMGGVLGKLLARFRPGLSGAMLRCCCCRLAA